MGGVKDRDRFVKLGDEVARRWSERNFDDERFAAIATTSLAESGILESTTLRDVARWFMSGSELPVQRARSFGQPPINVYTGRDFYIELLVWIDTPTSIHQHAFSGAWGVLHGSSFHSQFGFERRERICEPMVLGDLKYLSSELLHQGDIRTIEAGDRFIHSLLHLEAPSVSLVVRTNWQSAFAPQYRYLSPGLGLDPHHAPEPLETQIRLLRALLGTQPEMFAELAGEAVASGDLWFAYRVLEIAALHNVHSGLFATLLGALRERHPALGEIVGPALREQVRHKNIARHMKGIKNYEHRYLLAMLMNAPNRLGAQELIRKRFPSSNPEQKLLEWLAELSADGQLDYPFDETSLQLLKFAVRGESFSEAERALPESVRSDPQRRAAARKSWYEINSLELLQPLVRPGESARPKTSLAS